MPRLVQALPKYRKHRASGQVVVTINGRDHYLGPHGTKASRLQYDRLITEWLSSGRSVSFGAMAHETTIIELAADYGEFAEAYYGTGPNSELHPIVRVLRPVIELYGKTAAAEFDVQRFKAVRQRFLDEGPSRQFINASMKRIARMFRWAAGEGRVAPSVPQALALVPSLRKGKTTAPESRPVLPVEDAVVDATLPHWPKVVADMVRVQRLTGMRPAEVCMMRPCDVDRAGDVWEYGPPSHKTAHRDKQRTIFVGPEAQGVLLKYLARDAQMHCFRPCDSEVKRRAAAHAARKTPASCGNRPGTNKKRKPKRKPGECYNSMAYYHAIRYGCKRAFPLPEGLEGEALADWKAEHWWAPNRLRHSAATKVRRRYGLEAVQVVLGHAQARVTEVYAERDATLARRVMAEVG